MFDAHYQDTPRSTQVHTSALSVHFTAFEETADTYIEKFCATFARKKYQQESTRFTEATGIQIPLGVLKKQELSNILSSCFWF